ncbi:efflux RND transporter periplasmic adaptor subunit [Gemmatimonadota bacterium]
MIKYGYFNFLLLVFVVLALVIGCQQQSEEEHSVDVHQEETMLSGSPEAEAHDGERENAVHIEPENVAAFGIELKTAGPGKLEVSITLPGEISADPGRLVHIVPRISGVAREIIKEIGNTVRDGEQIAVLESRELSDLKSAYLIAKENLVLAESTFQREERLWKKKISSERTYLEARNKLAEARIYLESAAQKLHALGFSKKYVEDLAFNSGRPLSIYEIVSPIGGIVIEKHLSIGEAVERDTDIFTIANLSEVWVNLTVYQKDLPYVRTGQPVDISIKESGQSQSGVISYISPVVSEQTRAARARVVLSNVDGHWRPGLFVDAKVTAQEVQVPLLVDKDALITVEDRTVLFVKAGDRFELRHVEIGRENGTSVEIKSGLEPGESYVSQGVFTLKSELEKASFEGAGHGH